jgi:hypothetical protein
MIIVWISVWCMTIQLSLVLQTVIQVSVYASSDHASQLTLHSDSSKFDQGFDRHRYDDHMDIDPNSGASEEPSIPTHGKAPHHAQHDRVLDPNNGVPEELPTHGEAQQDGALFVERFPTGAAGVPIPNMGQEVPGFQVLHNNLGPDNIWHPFQSQCNWDFARWAKNRGPSLTAVTELLAMDGVHT